MFLTRDAHFWPEGGRWVGDVMSGVGGIYIFGIGAGFCIGWACRTFPTRNSDWTQLSPRVFLIHYIYLLTFPLPLLSLILYSTAPSIPSSASTIPHLPNTINSSPSSFSYYSYCSFLNPLLSLSPTSLFLFFSFLFFKYITKFVFTVNTFLCYRMHIVSGYCIIICCQASCM